MRDRLLVKDFHQIHRACNNFLSIMKLKLYENTHKDNWSSLSYDFLRKRITEELIELDKAIADNDLRNAQKELGDVANFCMMISDNISYGKFRREKL